MCVYSPNHTQTQSYETESHKSLSVVGSHDPGLPDFALQPPRVDRLECCFVDEEMCPGCQLEGPCHQPVGGVVLTRSELPAVHDRETKRQHDTLLDRDEE